MLYEEKFNKVVFKIKEDRKLTVKGKTSTIIFNNSSFTRVKTDEIIKILLQLQDDEEAILITEVIEDKDILDDLDPNKQLKNKYSKKIDTIVVEAGAKFDKWYEKYLIKQKSELENLSEKNFNNIVWITTVIEEELELTQSNALTINFIDDPNEIMGYDTADIENIKNSYITNLSYLKNKGIVKDFTTGPVNMFSEITINTAKFFDLLERIKNIKKNTRTYQPKSEPKPKVNQPTKNTIAHQLTYTKNREIILDNNYQLSKTDFESENDKVFSYLIQNPNKPYTVKNIEKNVTKETLTKTLHKIVENLGFTKQLRQVFFQVSKHSIMLKNPISYKDLNDLGIKKLRLK